MLQLTYLIYIFNTNLPFFTASWGFIILYVYLAAPPGVCYKEGTISYRYDCFQLSFITTVRVSIAKDKFTDTEITGGFSPQRMKLWQKKNMISCALRI